MVKGEVGLRVEIWRTAMKDEMRAEQMARLQSELEARAADASKGAALRQLRQIMVRIMKGEVGMKVEIWHMGVKMDAYAKYEAMQAALEAQMKAQGQGAGLRQLRQIMVRLVKGEVGLRVEIWRTAMKDEVRALEMARLQRDLEERAADASKGAGLRQLRQIMVRLMKGEVGMRVEIWRTGVKMDAYARHRELQAALEAQMQAQGQGAGLRQLRQIMMRMVKGEVGMRVEIWRTAMKDALHSLLSNEM